MTKPSSADTVCDQALRALKFLNVVHQISSAAAITLVAVAVLLTIYVMYLIVAGGTTDPANLIKSGVGGVVAVITRIVVTPYKKAAHDDLERGFSRVKECCPQDQT